ncbi:hypothetical protein [Leptospira jelokensis]|uniref:Uncharacterized protein n=1 Tax=Leptospira jelokensis TaxID=2484931 RepID=A0A4Z0ZY11_9LEPT|nr:hypothetical protein [Leptospira jelokensis]TGL65143.1 hypothetical protein EHQ62_11195 [Leptospira jelokensis]
MYQKYRRIIVIIIFSQVVSCVSIPFQPANNTDECLAYYFQTKRQVTEIFDENVLTLGLVVSLSILNTAISPIFVYPLLTTPFIQFRNKMRADDVLNQWKTEKCGMKKGNQIETEPGNLGL